MSIRDRLDDAKILCHNGRFEGGLLSALVAVAATSRRRYPFGTISKANPKKKMADREAFTEFLGREMIVVTAGAVKNIWLRFRNKRISQQELFYEHLRCELVHNSSLPQDVTFVDGVVGSQMTKLSDGGVTYSKDWLNGLARCVAYAPENSDEYPEFAALSDGVLRQQIFGDRCETKHVNEYWLSRRTTGCAPDTLDGNANVHR